MAAQGEGRVEALFLKVGHGAPMARVHEAQARAGFGLAGDVSFGRPKRQVLAIEIETLDRYGLDAGDVRENVVVRGLRLAGTAPGTRVVVGPVTLEVTLDCAPCAFIDGLRPGLASEMDGQRGTLLRVLSDGTIRDGDPVIIEIEPALVEGAEA